MSDPIEIAEEPRDEIVRLEDRIHELGDGLERCRKIRIFSNALVAAGALWLIAGLLGLVGGGISLVGSIAAILGGLVLNGSNRSTAQQIRAAIDAAETRRRDLIAAIGLRLVHGQVESEADGRPAAPARWLH